MNYQSQVNRKEVISQMKDNSVMILFSGNTIKSSADVEYPFVVNRNFYHLTQINQPNLILVLSKESEILYIEKSDELFEKWVGKKITKQQSMQKSNIKDIRFLDEFNNAIFEDFENIYLDLEEDQFNNYLTPALQFQAKHKLKALDAFDIIAKSRSTKGEAEVKKMLKAIEITNKGLKKVMKNLKPNVKESHFEAHFDFVLKDENVLHAFDTIVASGENATTLHYVTNNEVVKDNDLILFDLGATYDLYCADISRTYPANGKFTKRQKELYEMVLEANNIVIDAIKPGVTMQKLNDIVVKFYAKQLKKLQVISESHQVKDYYYHGVSHSLGLDTHDIGLDRETPLVAGNVITVEPGIYIKEEGIGIRIEDNILVTEDGAINLSKDIIKTVSEIEEFIKNEQKK